MSRHTLANVLRNLATALTLAAERVDPQPPVEDFKAFTVQSGTGTTTWEPHVTWHEVSN